MFSSCESCEEVFKCHREREKKGRMREVDTVKEDIFVGEKFRTFPSKTFRMELNFVLSERLQEVKTRRDYRKVCKPDGRKFGMEINFVLVSILRKLRNYIPYENFFFYSCGCGGWGCDSCCKYPAGLSASYCLCNVPCFPFLDLHLSFSHATLFDELEKTNNVALPIALL